MAYESELRFDGYHSSFRVVIGGGDVAFEADGFIL